MPIRKLIAGASLWVMYGAGLAVLLMMLHVVADVSMKVFFNRPISGTLETVSYYYMVAAVFLPLAFAESKSEHISVDLAYERFPPWGKKICRVVGLLISLALFWIFFYQTLADALRAFAISEVAMGSARLTLWPARFILPFSFALILMVLVVKLLSELAGQDADTLDGTPPDRRDPVG